MIVFMLLTVAMMLFMGALALALLIRLMKALLKFGLAFMVGAAVALSVVLAVGLTGADQIIAGTIGCIAALLSAGAMLVFLHRRDARAASTPMRELSEPASGWEQILISRDLAQRVEDARRDIKVAASAQPLNISLSEWVVALDRIPQLIAATVALYPAASRAEQRVLRAQLAEDLTHLVRETDRRLASIRQADRATLRRWVAIRTGRS